MGELMATRGQLLDTADAEPKEKERDLERLRAEVHRLEGELLDLAIDNEELINLSNAMSGQFALISQPPTTTRPECASEDEVPDQVSTIVEAITLGRRLSHIVIHKDAPVDIEKLDATVTAGAWANTIWRGLRALNAYAAQENAIPGGFYEWCRRSDSPWMWPASEKKLAMRESQGVMNNPRLRAARSLPITRELSPAGRREMTAHLKISQGGSPLAPRIYFYDDTGGPTGKIHVGFIGPHEHMPNLSTD
jgi:hypothetical protein